MKEKCGGLEAQLTALRKVCASGFWSTAQFHDGTAHSADNSNGQYLVLSNLRISLLNLWIPILIWHCPIQGLHCSICGYPILICDMGLSNSRIVLLNLWILALLCPQEVEGMKVRQKKAAGQQGALEVRLNRALEEAERYKTELATMRARSEVGVALWHACMCLQFHSEV